jgi:3'(2'), 5'-bisphosphate nucleotidase
VVELALVEMGRVVMGAMGCPNLDARMRPDFDGPGSVVVAVRHEGAWSRPMGGGDFRRLSVSDCAEPECVRMLRSYESSHTDPEMIEKIAHELGVVREPVLMDSAAKYGLLAGGQGELILRLLSPAHPDYTENIWDHAAGALIVEEAGGRITDLGGKTLDFGLGRGLVANVGLLVSNGPLHDTILDIIARYDADQRPGSA